MLSDLHQEQLHSHLSQQPFSLSVPSTRPPCVLSVLLLSLSIIFETLEAYLSSKGNNILFYRYLKGTRLYFELRDII